MRAAQPSRVYICACVYRRALPTVFGKISIRRRGRLLSNNRLSTLTPLTYLLTSSSSSSPPVIRPVRLCLRGCFILSFLSRPLLYPRAYIALFPVTAVSDTVVRVSVIFRKYHKYTRTDRILQGKSRNSCSCRVCADRNHIITF